MSLFAGVSAVTLQAWLTDAQAAYHALMTGTKTVYVQHDTRRVQYSQATAAELWKYIESLQMELAILAGAPSGKPYSVAVWTR